MVTMRPRAQIHLCERVQTDKVQQVDQHGEFDAITGDERNLFQDASIAAVFTCQGLHEASQPRPEHVYQRPGDQLADPTAAAGDRTVIGHEWAQIVRLDERHIVLTQQGAEQSDDELRSEVAQV